MVYACVEFAAVSLFSWSLGIPVAAQTPVSTSNAISTEAAASTVSKASLTKIHIDNFGHINANYYRSAQPNSQDYADLAELGVKTVIDLTEDGERRRPGSFRHWG